MFCAAKTPIKVCTSLTTATSGVAATCGTYQILDFTVINNKVDCLSTEIQLSTRNEFESAVASPFHLTISQGSLIASAILATWAVGYVFKLINKTLGDHSPE
jgi:hypothetical protein